MGKLVALVPKGTKDGQGLTDARQREQPRFALPAELSWNASNHLETLGKGCYMLTLYVEPLKQPFYFGPFTSEDAAGRFVECCAEKLMDFMQDMQRLSYDF